MCGGGSKQAKQAQAAQAQQNAALLAELQQQRKDQLAAASAQSKALYGGVDGAGYASKYSDVGSWAQQAVASGEYATLDDAAKAHFEKFGKGEGREIGYTPGQMQLQADAITGAAQSASDSTKAASDQMSDMIRSLTESMARSQKEALDFMRKQQLESGNSKKSPNLGVIGRRVAEMYKGRKSMLTGPRGVDNGQLSLGKNSLLGA